MKREDVSLKHLWINDRGMWKPRREFLMSALILGKHLYRIILDWSNCSHTKLGWNIFHRAEVKVVLICCSYLLIYKDKRLKVSIVAEYDEE